MSSYPTPPVAWQLFQITRAGGSLKLLHEQVAGGACSGVRSAAMQGGWTSLVHPEVSYLCSKPVSLPLAPQGFPW